MIQPQTQEKLNSIFDKAGLPRDKKDFWFSRLGNVPQEALEHIIALFEAYPAEIGWFSDLQVRKEKAMAEKDQKAWDGIIKEEEQRILTLLGNNDKI